MFIVVFNKKDGVIEEYCYYTIADALYHYNLFLKDTSDLYSRIDIIVHTNEFEEVILSNVI